MVLIRTRKIGPYVFVGRFTKYFASGHIYLLTNEIKIKISSLLGRLLPSSDKIKEKTEPKGVRNGLAHNGGTKLKPPR